jgi:arylsulfatase
MNNLRVGLNRNGPWHLLVEKDGTYEIELRRWPKEADAPIAAGVMAFKTVDGSLPPGEALPIAKARLTIDGLAETKPVGPKDKGVTFTVKLRQGRKLPMQSWFYDADGKQLCGAYFAYIRRK